MGQSLNTNFRENIWLHFAALVCFVFILHGKPVPFSNEYIYLLNLVNTYDPSFLLNDFTFTNQPNAYWLFNQLFGAFTIVFSVEVIGWGGRILCWSVLLVALMRLGKQWEIPVWMISLSIFLWLAIGQALVADEWMIGGFEAKCIAYIFLLFSINGFCAKRDGISSVFLGLTFAFHPIVGLWGISATLFGLLFTRKTFREVFKVGAIATVISLIGLIPILITKLNGESPAPESLRFLEVVVFPFHFDPTSWARSSIILLYLIALFCFLFFAQTTNKESTDKFFALFLGFLCAIFTLGLLLFATEQYRLLEYMPMRLFPLFAPLFFFFTVARLYVQRGQIKLYKTLIAVGALCMCAFIWVAPFKVAYGQMAQTYEGWTKPQDDISKAFVWLKENTPNGTVVISPTWRRDYWHLSRRAEIANFTHPTYSKLGEWQSRLNEIMGEVNQETAQEIENLSEIYFNLPKERIDSLSTKYKASYLISEKSYPFPTVFTSGIVKIYDLKSGNQE